MLSLKFKKLFNGFLINVGRPMSKNYVPRWLIFAIDMLIAFVAVKASFILVNSISSEPLAVFSITWQLIAILIIQAFYFFVFKSFSGLVRYSSFRDAITQLQVAFCTVLTILIVNQIYYLTAGEKLILDGGVMIYGMLTFCLLFFFRVVIKKAYQILHSNKKQKTAYILGADRQDVAMAEGLISENAHQFQIIGFIDNHPSTLRTRIFNLPVYHIDQLKGSRTLTDVAVIVREDKLKRLRNDNGILNELLELKTRIFKLPAAQDWKQSRTNNLREIKIEDLLQRSPIKLDKSKLQTHYHNKTIIVTGAAGSIGSEIVRQLTYFHPKKIILLDQAETPLHILGLELDQNYPDLNYEKIIANVRNKKRLQEVFEHYQPEVVFHGAAYKHVPLMESNPAEAISVNFGGTRNLVDLSIAHNIERFVFVSTDKAVNPTNIMGATKRAAELYVQYVANNKSACRTGETRASEEGNNSTTFITTRFGNVLGSNGSVIPHFKKQIAHKGPITVTHPEITRYFMTIDEACQLVLEAGAMGNGGEIYVFDMGEPIKILELAEHMIRLTGLIPHKDIEIEFSGLRPGEKLYEELLADKEKTLQTHHKKILIAQETHNFDVSKITLLTDLLRFIQAYETENSLRTLKLLVPEYCKEQQIASADKKTV